MARVTERKPRAILSEGLLLLVAILPQALFALVGGDFMTLTLFSAGHCLRELD